MATMEGSRTIIDPVTEVALPPALVQEGDERVDVGSTRATAHDRVGCDHWQLLQRDGETSEKSS